METQFKRFTVRFLQSKYNVLGFVLFSLISLHAIYSFTHKLSSPFSSEPTSSKSKVSDFRDFQYWNSSGPFGPVIHPPQPSKDGPYHDRLIAEGGGKNNEEGFTVSKERAVIIPSFVNASPHCSRLLLTTVLGRTLQASADDASLPTMPLPRHKHLQHPRCAFERP